jgi:hypothetical protein
MGKKTRKAVKSSYAGSGDSAVIQHRLNELKKKWKLDLTNPIPPGVRLLLTRSGVVKESV